MNLHGTVSFVWDDDLIIISAKGPFNEEGLQESIAKIQSAILVKGIGLWRRMEIFDDETLGSPSCIKLSKAADQWFFEHGCYATAIVVSNRVQRALLEQANARNLGIFDDIESAKEWLGKQKKI